MLTASMLFLFLSSSVLVCVIVARSFVTKSFHCNASFFIACCRLTKTLCIKSEKHPFESFKLNETLEWNFKFKCMCVRVFMHKFHISLFGHLVCDVD